MSCMCSVRSNYSGSGCARRLHEEQVRKIARSLGLPAADRPESQEICFIEDNDYCRFLETLSPPVTRRADHRP